MASTYGAILNVNPDPVFSSSIKAYLEDAGFSVLEAKTPLDAIERFKEQTPDLILSGLSQTADRHVLNKAIRQYIPETPVVAVIPEQDKESLIDAIRGGAWDFIITPVEDLAVLEHVVCRALERSRLVVENKAYRKQLETTNEQLSENLRQLEEDQKAGRVLQQQMLPKSNLKIGPYHLSYTMIPSLYLSGDFIDYFQINATKMGFYIADVSGHGASSAFVTILLKSIFDQQLEHYHSGQEDLILVPEALLKKVSDDIWQAKLGKYLTMIYGVIDLDKNEISYSVGGHYPSPIIYDGKRAQFLPGMGYAVGILKEIHFTCQAYALPKEFTLLLCSDGVLELISGQNLTDKEGQLLNLMQSKQTSVQEIVNALGVKQNIMPPDDVTILMIKREAA